MTTIKLIDFIRSHHQYCPTAMEYPDHLHPPISTRYMHHQPHQTWKRQRKWLQMAVTMARNLSIWARIDLGVEARTAPRKLASMICPDRTGRHASTSPPMPAKTDGSTFLPTSAEKNGMGIPPDAIKHLAGTTPSNVYHSQAEVYSKASPAILSQQ